MHRKLMGTVILFIVFAMLILNTKYNETFLSYKIFKLYSRVFKAV